MKQYFSEEQINHSYVLLWETDLANAKNPEDLNEQLNVAFSSSELSKILEKKNVTRLGRAIYRNDDTDKFAVATIYDGDPKRMYDVMNEEFMGYVDEAIPHLDIEYICITCGKKYFKSCVHTDNAREALLAFDTDEREDRALHNYVVLARKEVQKISGDLPRLFKNVDAVKKKGE